MTPERKTILIRTIIHYLAEETEHKNKQLVRQNLYSEQEKFDYADIFFKLAFMRDDHVEEIANLILG